MERFRSPGVSLRSTARLNLDFSLREKSCRQFSVFSFQLSARSCRRVLQNYDFALIVGTSLCDVGLIIRILYRRAKGTSLHLGSSATPSRYRGWDAGELPLAPTTAYESACRGSIGLSARRAPTCRLRHAHCPHGRTGISAIRAHPSRRRWRSPRQTSPASPPRSCVDLTRNSAFQLLN